MKYFLLLTSFLLLVGCANAQNSNENIPESAIETDQSAELEVEDTTFKDYMIPQEFILKRELSHAETYASYNFYEFEVNNTLNEVNEWLRSESARLGGKTIERYSYDMDDSRLDLIIEFPSKVGTRMISTYTRKYIDKQHLIIEETLIKKSITVDQNYEDHALIVYTPLDDNSTKEAFKGDYYHQHTDIYSIYFYTQAFFNELIEISNYNLDLKYDMTKDELDFVVGYFDKEGNVVDPESITEENRQEFTFGIQLNRDFLPKEEARRETLLFHWAKTVLMGDNAYSRVFDGGEEINFLFEGQVFKSFTLKELI